MENIKLKVEYLPIDELKPYERNTRKHEERDILAIMESIKQFGFNDPIGLWHDTIVEGHGRLLAAKELGMEEVPVIRLEHLTDEQRRAYANAHNRTAELSSWDYDMLELELEDLSLDMSLFGFEPITKYTPEALEEFFVEAYTPTVTQGNTQPQYTAKEPAQRTEIESPKTTITCPHCGKTFEL